MKLFHHQFSISLRLPPTFGQRKTTKLSCQVNSGPDFRSNEEVYESLESIQFPINAEMQLCVPSAY
jgi:hypothetical protein